MMQVCQTKAEELNKIETKNHFEPSTHNLGISKNHIIRLHTCLHSQMCEPLFLALRRVWRESSCLCHNESVFHYSGT